MRKALLIAVAVALPFLAAGCGEKPKVIFYQPGEYQGKSDNQPWDNEQFKGDKVAWEKAIKARTLGQNEYARSTPTAN